MHVVQRGVARRATFLQQSDYCLYMRFLHEAAEKHGCQIHAYVLMTNHAHLLLTPQEQDSLPLLMQSLGRSYVQSFNKKYDRTGTLWDGRYKACLVQYDRYFLACQKYVEMNPVRAGMVEMPSQYRFSSFAHNALGKVDPLLTPHSLYLSLGSNARQRCTNYLQSFNEQLDANLLAAIREETSACRAIGSDNFKAKLEGMLGRSVRPGRGGRPKTGV